MSNYLSSPHTIYIDVTNMCNLNCKHCFTGRQKKRFMDKAMFESIIKQAVKLEVFGIVISGGEPFMHKSIIDFISFANNEGLLVGISTNGTLIDKDIAKIVSNMISNVQVSLDGSNALSHGFIRNSTDAFDKAINGIHNLKSAGSYVTVSTVVSEHNIQELSELIELCVRLDVDRLKLQRIKKIGNALLNDTVNSNVDIKKLKNLADSYRIKNIDIVIDDPLNESYKCTAGTEVIYFNPEGRVFPCPFLLESNLEFGIIDVGDQNWIEGIWNSDKIISFRSYKTETAKEFNSTCLAERR